MTDHTSETPLETGQKKAEDTAEAVKSRAATLKDEAARTAQNVASGAKARVEAEVSARAEGAKDAVASAVEDTAETLRTAAERMSDGTPQSEAVHRAANTVHGVAAQIRDADVASLAEDLSGLARRYPVPFLAGAALAGFAVGRFLKASARPKTGGYGYGDGYELDRPVPAHQPVRPPAPAYPAGARPEGTLETDGPATTPKPLPVTPSAATAGSTASGGSPTSTSGPTPTARPVASTPTQIDTKEV